MQDLCILWFELLCLLRIGKRFFESVCGYERSGSVGEICDGSWLDAEGLREIAILARLFPGKDGREDSTCRQTRQPTFSILCYCLVVITDLEVLVSQRFALFRVQGRFGGGEVVGLKRCGGGTGLVGPSISASPIFPCQSE